MITTPPRTPRDAHRDSRLPPETTDPPATCPLAADQQLDELTSIRIVPTVRRTQQPNRSDPTAAPAHTRRLSRTLVNFWLDAMLGGVFVLLSITAVIVQFVFPPGIAARGVSLWGMSYGQWCSLQFALIATLGLGVLVHVMLHWSWVCGVLARRILGQSSLPDDGIRTIYGVGLLIGLLLSGAVAVGLAQWMIVLP